VRCKVPKGLIALSGIPSGFSGVRDLVTSEWNVASDFWSWARDVGVTRGMQRKCVRRGGVGVGGILGMTVTNNCFYKFDVLV